MRRPRNQYDAFTPLDPQSIPDPVKKFLREQGVDLSKITTVAKLEVAKRIAGQKAGLERWRRSPGQRRQPRTIKA